MRFAVAIKLHRRSVPSAALHWASEHGQNEWIKPLLDKGVDVNSTECGCSDTALHATAANGHVDCLTTLVEHGADVNAGADVWTPLHDAADCCNTECVIALLRHGAEINRRTCVGSTPFHNAA